MTPDFQALCERYDLSSMSVMHMAKFQRRPLTIYLHWEDVGTCSSGNGDTFEEAFANALTEMVERRPGYELADPIVTALDAIAAREVAACPGAQLEAAE